MIIACFILIFAVAIVVIEKEYRSPINPFIFFSGIWAFIVFLYSLHLFGLREGSEQVVYLIFIGVISFGTGYLLLMINNKYKIVNNYNKESKLYDLRYKLILFLGYLCILFYLNDFIISLSLVLKGNDLDAIRVLAQDQNSILNREAGGIYNLIKNFIILPSVTAIEVIAVVDYWFGKCSKHLFFVNIGIIIMRVVSDAGRTPLVNFMLYMLLAYFLLSTKQSNKGSEESDVDKKNKKRIKVITAAGFILGVILTISRSGVLIIRHLYFYFAMPPYLFSYWKDTIDKLGNLAYGTASLNGLVFSISYFFKNLFNTQYPEFIQTVYNQIAQTDRVWPVIAAGGTKANAYVSAFWFFYFDGRTIGIIIGMFLYGLLATKIYLDSKKSGSVKSISLYLLLFQGIAFSFIRFPFAKIYYSLAFLLIMFIAYKPIGSYSSRSWFTKIICLYKKILNKKEM